MSNGMYMPSAVLPFGSLYCPDNTGSTAGLPRLRRPRPQLIVGPLAEESHVADVGASVPRIELRTVRNGGPQHRRLNLEVQHGQVAPLGLEERERRAGRHRVTGA